MVGYVAAVLATAMALVIGDASAGYANSGQVESAIAAVSAGDAGNRQVSAELGSVTAVAAGTMHSIALRSDGTVVAWGARNDWGQLGIGTTRGSLTPTPVCAVGQRAPCTEFLTGVIAIAAGAFHSLALLRDRTVVGWGYNRYGQVGNRSNVDEYSPRRVCAVESINFPCFELLRGVRTLTAGGLHSLAQLTDGTVVSWGSNSYGQLGDGTTVDRVIPVRVCAVGEVAPCARFLTGVRALDAGDYHTLAAVDSAQAIAWGNNFYGQLGDGTTVSRVIPVRVCAIGEVAPCSRFLNAVKELGAGGRNSMALLGNGSPVAWGYNEYGQLGDGTRTNRLTPVRVCAVGEVAPCARFLYGIRHIASGEFYSIAQLSSGGVVAWGYNEVGQLGDGTRTTRLTPARVCAVGQVAPCTKYLSLIRAVSASYQHNLALQPDYTVAAWGWNEFGQIGNGTFGIELIPVQVLAPRPALR
ncbi:RCC1 domain-containing protein [Micromonospora sp. LOL_021]|uniref:RCC1 domain-containing protein n=1 Tax=Micromonospora sp. LOL_021 TaxID=3345417 RepID=UPI003A860696